MSSTKTMGTSCLLRALPFTIREESSISVPCFKARPEAYRYQTTGSIGNLCFRALVCSLPCTEIAGIEGCNQKVRTERLTKSQNEGNDPSTLKAQSPQPP